MEVWREAARTIRRSRSRDRRTLPQAPRAGSNSLSGPPPARISDSHGLRRLSIVRQLHGSSRSRSSISRRWRRRCLLVIKTPSIDLRDDPAHRAIMPDGMNRSGARHSAHVPQACQPDAKTRTTFTWSPNTSKARRWPVDDRQPGALISKRGIVEQIAACSQFSSLEIP